MRSADLPPSAPRQSRTGTRSFPKFFLALCCALPLWLGTALAISAATNNTGAKPVAVSKYAKGLLWKIEAPGIKPSHLFGTIHSDDARVTALPEAVTRALDASHRFVMEALIDGEGLVRMAEAMYYNDGRTLEQVVGKELYAESVKALTARGIPTLGVEKQKPWAVMMALSMPPPKTGEYLDLMLETRATRQNKPVSGLETVQEQIAVFNELPLPDQIALLKETVRSQHDFDKEFEELTKAWLARDLATIAAISEDHEPVGDRLYRNVMDRLLTARNTRMAGRMASMLKEGNAFIAVGAAHLPGETGLLNLIEKAGYRVTPVY